MLSRLRGIFILIVTLCIPFISSGSHLVGGDLTYKCLGTTANGWLSYEIRLDIYQDCLTGSDQAIREDNPAFIAIYDAVTNQQVYYNNNIKKSDNFDLLIPPNFKNNCINNAPRTCLRRWTFFTTAVLPPNPNGYLILYQRCCRNSSTANILNPGVTGTSYFSNIPPPPAACNNSAVFKNYPPQIICVNNPLFYDNSATDADGDSLSYELCTAYAGGNINDVKPNPPVPSDIKPVIYRTGFSDNKPMTGNPAIQIDPQTGLLTGTPNLMGRYIVTVCCHEWRNGVKINTTRRDFQFEVTNCSKAVVADIPIFSDEPNTYIIKCDGFTVDFVNRSTGGFEYSWDFGDPTTTNDQSADFEPSYTYPDTGTYTVKLVVNRGSTCPDSIERIVKVYPYFNTEFTTEGLLCPNGEIKFIDRSTSTYEPINYWEWHFGDDATSNQQNTTHIYPAGGDYNVQFISENALGCTDTAQRTLSIERFRPFAGNDTIIVKGERINFNATGGIIYRWTPSTYLNAYNIPNPTGYYPDTTRIGYEVYIKSEQGCEGTDSINVWVVNQASLFVPSGFTPNGDGLNDILKPVGVGYTDIRFFRVFNRWGQKVFDTEQFGIGWDGTFNGIKADVGVYFWVLGVTNRFGEEEQIKGDVTLIR